MSTSAGSFILDYAVPSLGCTLSITMFLTPLPEIFNIQKRQFLNGFNLTPYPLMILNCITWIVYAATLPAPSCIFVFLANWVGCMSGAVILSVAYPLASMADRFRIASVFVFMTAFCMPMCFVLFQSLSTQSFSQVIGGITMVVQFAFFASPLLNIVNIVKTKSSASLYAPMAVMTCVSSFCWGTYGYVLQNNTIFVPNAMAFTVGAVQVALCCLFPSESAPLIQEIDEDDLAFKRTPPKSSNGSPAYAGPFGDSTTMMSKRPRYTEDTPLIHMRKTSI
jgi:solute carrier family 50 protein (sugar transporter)